MKLGRGGRLDRSEQLGRQRDDFRIAQQQQLLDDFTRDGAGIDRVASIASRNRAAQARRVTSKLWADASTSSDMLA